MSSSKIQFSDCLSNSGYHREGKPNWWAMIDGKFVEIGWHRGDRPLCVEVAVPVGTQVEIGVGKAEYKKSDKIRATIVTTELEGR